jgi:hypothetical protein
MEAAVMRRFSKRRIIRAGTVAALCAIAVPAWAGYLVNGYDFGPVQSGSGLANTAANVQTNPLWSASGTGQNVTTTFTLPQCQTVDFSRLYLDVYGGTPYKTAQVTATLNGIALPTLNIGGTGNLDDSNPATRDPNATCVYGSGFGYWEIGYAGVASLLKTNGSANSLTYTVSSGTNFDGRTYGATLVTVYSDPGIHQTLDYQLFEGDAMMRGSTSTSPPYPQQNLGRSLTITGVNASNVTSAMYTAGYAGGHNGQLDQVYFNENALGIAAGLGNDVAHAGYATEVHSFDVSGDNLAAIDTVRYSIDGAALGGTGESTLYPDFGLLTVTHPVPEPSTVVLLVTGTGVFLMMRWRNRRWVRTEASESSC